MRNVNESLNQIGRWRRTSEGSDCSEMSLFEFFWKHYSRLAPKQESKPIFYKKNKSSLTCKYLIRADFMLIINRSIDRTIWFPTLHLVNVEAFSEWRTHYIQRLIVCSWIRTFRLAEKLFLAHPYENTANAAAKKGHIYGWTTMFKANSIANENTAMNKHQQASAREWLLMGTWFPVACGGVLFSLNT